MTPLAQGSRCLKWKHLLVGRLKEVAEICSVRCKGRGLWQILRWVTGVGEQVTPIESVGDTLQDSSVSSQEVSRKNRSRRYMTRSLKVSANVPGKVGQQPCVPPTKSSQDEGRKREKNKEKRQRSNTVTRIQSGMGKRVRS